MQARSEVLRGTLRIVGPLALIFLVVWLLPAMPEIKGLAAYLPLHSALEMFAIAVAVMVFAIGWIAITPGLRNIVLLGCAFLGVGLIEFGHLLSYQGMPEFVTPSDPEKAIAFWLATRFLEAGALLFVALSSWQPVATRGQRYSFLAGVLIYVAIVYWVILFHQDSLPRTFVAGVGLTPLKIGLEYLLAAMYLAAAAAFFVRAHVAQPFDVGGLLIAALILALSELFFTRYSEVTDHFNLLGHVYNVIAYGFICKSVFVDNVRLPYQRLARSQQKLLEVNQFNAALLDTAGAIVIVLDAAGCVQRFNRAAQQITGFGCAEIESRSILELCPPGTDKESFAQAMAGLLAGEPHMRFETRCAVKGGGARVVDWSCTALRDEQGGVEYIICTGIDVTEARRAAEEAQRHLAELARVSRITLLGEMASAMAHELNQPLAAVVNYTQGCVRRLRAGRATDDEALLKAMEQATLQAQRAAEIIRRIRDFMRKEDGQRELVNLNQLVRHVVDMVQHDLRRHGIQVSLDLSEPLAPVRATAIQIEQVLLHLLRNAIEAMERTPVEQRSLRIRTEQRSDGTVEASLQDAGSGLSAEALEQLFAPFYTTKPEGMGLGLSISQSIVESHGGACTSRATPRAVPSSHLRCRRRMHWRKPGTAARHRAPEAWGEAWSFDRRVAVGGRSAVPRSGLFPYRCRARLRHVDVGLGIPAGRTDTADYLPLSDNRDTSGEGGESALRGQGESQGDVRRDIALMGGLAHGGGRIGLAVGGVVGVGERPVHLDEACQIAAPVHHRDAHGHPDFARPRHRCVQCTLNEFGGQRRLLRRDGRRYEHQQRAEQECRGRRYRKGWPGPGVHRVSSITSCVA